MDGHDDQPANRDVQTPPARPVSADEEEDETISFKVVLNHEEQYSIWWADREIPPGWREEGKRGTKAECLAHIDEVWTDMRPLSLRREMEERAAAAARGELPPEPEAEAEPDGPTLVERLSQGTHPVRISVTPEGSRQALVEAITRGYVHVTFTDTRGGTELGMRLDREACELGGLEGANGIVRLVGHLTLDYVPVRSVAAIDLATLAGQGHLELC